MKRILFGLIALILAGCSAQEHTVQSATSSLPDLGPAPEFTNETWLNVDAPLRLADLRGKVVTVDWKKVINVIASRRRSNLISPTNASSKVR